MNGRSILLVEDDDAIRESVAECLDAEGYAVAMVENGVAGLEWLRRSPRPHLVVLDLVMPVMNGAQFLETLRADPALRDLPVVLMTAALPSEQLPVPVADGYLTKPFELDELLETVARHARRP
ncbi:response regulator [Anaeromyxobacter sp. Red801]|uniref:response regulator n=1 Tax=Anaeromyxobacter sp. Red801 TaxID=3411632 RepID=UPI003B9FC020